MAWQIPGTAAKVLVGMPVQEDILFGNIALKWGWVPKDLLQRALMYQQARAPEKRLGQILIEYGYLSPQQVAEIYKYQERIRNLRAQASQATTQSQWQNPNAMTVTNRWRSPIPQPPPPAPGPQPGSQMSFNDGGGAAVALGPTPNPDQDPLLGETIGGCQINAKIGQGAMATVYLAHHTSLRKDVVVKILSQELSQKPRTVERFFREARAAARLEHPNIVSVFDVGTERDMHFMVMQYIHGQNLEEKIREEGRQSPDEAVRIASEVASGLQVAHAQSVIHRDIKADNILITTNGTVKITDFGLAKDLNLDPLTMEGAFIGTPLYMAPEIGREEVDGRADVYSLGVTFYYLLTGVQPFKEFSAMEILRAQAHEKIAAPETHLPDLPDPHRRVLGKMLAKDRAERYADMGELLSDLEALKRGLPVEAGPPKIWDDAPKKSSGSRRRSGRRPPSPVSRSGQDEEISTGLVVLLGVAILVVVALLVVFLLLLFS